MVLMVEISMFAFNQKQRYMGKHMSDMVDFHYLLIGITFMQTTKATIMVKYFLRYIMKVINPSAFISCMIEEKCGVLD